VPVETTSALDVLNGHADMARRRPLVETIVALSQNHFWVQSSGERQIEHAIRRHSLGVLPGDRQFDQAAPNRVRVTEVANVWTDEGWLYLAVMLDLWTSSRAGSWRGLPVR
jgi:hypothetical protein